VPAGTAPVELPMTLRIGGGPTVGRLGFGAMSITGRGVWGAPRDEGEAIALLRRVVEKGVTFIDTADSYGPEVSETLIAKALYPYPVGLVIASKGGLTRPGPGFWDVDCRPEHLRRACAGSLRRLRLERIELYQIHAVDHRVPIEDSIGTLVDLQREGKIRFIGVSNVSAAELARARKVAEIVSVQNSYNLRDPSSDALVDICAGAGIAFIPYYPLAKGRLARSDSCDSGADRAGMAAAPFAGHIADPGYLLARPFRGKSRGSFDRPRRRRIQDTLGGLIDDRRRS